MTSTYAVLSEGLEKRFGEVHALRGLDLAVAPGAVCGILGSNGAGKTTAVRLLTTLLRPDAGSARVAGHDLVREPEAVRRAIAVTGQYASVDGDLTGRQNLRLFARLHRVRGPAERAADLLDRFGLAESADRAASTYSGGMRRRLDLAASLIRRPEILFLDEPTTGLDPASRNLIWDAVRDLTADGTTVLLTTQYLEEADQLAHDIALVDKGRVAHTGSPSQLKALIGAHVEIVVADADVLAKAAGVLDQLTGGEPSFDHVRNSVGAVTRDTTLTLPRLVRELDAAGVPLLDASIRPPTLDDVFLRLTKEVAA
ncbi:ATP-binding cassette domain-containing protein [Streptomyces canus]|uniref:ABC-2 type transport system ATP-binding protein n=1 Tax=Streptomyces canus TaxID=58343 RepID=A0AAW8FRE8_9ACTN|nr:ATP-binding cassette domain-containing protein [Streptomyces canus]MDQ0759531.1 ABC-2 type transport system ATP-binding protein [Streptomyces canus]MDQ0911855.1 ABC-2 type transport system ATP-binding protein [Streptomyces canus]MDQ1071839.1 ABC-2 type transport system ATP-binding protein [Streptomyces canus]